MTNLEHLSTQLAATSADHRLVERLLCNAWGSGEITVTTNDTNLEPYKLLNRTEHHQYNHPVFTFDIERHGATVNGSVNAEVHTWQVNTQTGEAGIVSTRNRQVRPKSAKLDTVKLAAELAAIICEHRHDPRIKWTGEDARILIGEAIPTTNRMTTNGRRRRFRVALESALPDWSISRGWLISRKPEAEQEYERRIAQSTNAAMR